MKDKEDVEKIIGEPVFDEFTENTLRIRRNLFFVSAITLFYKIGNLQIAEGQLGFLTIKNLQPETIDQGLFWVIAYLLIHFVWNSWTNFQEFKLRLSGSRVQPKPIAVYASESGDYPSDPRQSTLYQWWLQSAPSIGNVGKDAQILDETVKDWDTKIEEAIPSNQKINLEKIINGISEIREQIVALIQKINEAEKILSAERIPVSLKRFDRSFWQFQKNQLARWFFVEWLLPIILGVWALSLTWPFNLLNFFK